MVARVAFAAGLNNQIPLLNQLVGMRNLLINGGFTINQRGYVSAAALAATNYGHDRWKAGAGGGDYSFTQLPNYTAITVAANKSIIQVVEDRLVVGGQYILSWTGTCLARYGLNSNTPSGSFVTSPIVIAGQNPGTTMSVEFGNGASAGTLSFPQLELGISLPTDFEVRHDILEKILCQRYYEKSFPPTVAPAQNAGVAGAVYMIAAGTAQSHQVHFKVLKRSGAPNIVTYNPSAANTSWRDVTGAADRALTIGANSINDWGFAMFSNAFVAGNANMVHWTASDEL